jgi:hypothetical protein
MKLPASFVVTGALFACMSISYPANADSGGTCNISPNHVLRLTFGGAASGQALSGNGLGIPPGAFSRLGVATAITAAYDRSGKHIVGTWSDTIVTNDSDKSDRERRPELNSTAGLVRYAAWCGRQGPD